MTMIDFIADLFCRIDDQMYALPRIRRRWAQRSGDPGSLARFAGGG